MIDPLERLGVADGWPSWRSSPTLFQVSLGRNITLSNGHSASGELDGGDSQLHPSDDDCG